MERLPRDVTIRNLTINHGTYNIINNFFFMGNNEIRDLSELKEFNDIFRELSSKMEPQVYELGFLRK